MVLPPVVGGVALLLAFGRNGIAGQWLDRWLRASPSRSPRAGADHRRDVRGHAVPRDHGGGRPALHGPPLRGRRRHARRRPLDDLPARHPAAHRARRSAPARRSRWARALGEFGATITFAGNLPGTTQTMPLAVYLALQNNPDAAITLSLVMLVVSPRRAGRRCATAGSRRDDLPVDTARGGPMSLEAQVAWPRARCASTSSSRAETGDVVVLLGPNAAGKTTLLRALAGLVPLERGRVTLDGVVLDDPAAGVRVPTERRPVGVVFQDYLLFPHLTALENVAFGLRSRGAGRGARARARARDARPRGPGRPAPRRGPGRSPAGRRSASRWRARSRPTRACCCSTSRSRPWTPARARSCAATSPGTSPPTRAPAW